MPWSGFPPSVDRQEPRYQACPPDALHKSRQPIESMLWMPLLSCCSWHPS